MSIGQTRDEAARRLLSKLSKELEPFLYSPYSIEDRFPEGMRRQAEEEEAKKERQEWHRHNAKCEPLMRIGRVKEEDRDRFGQIVQRRVAAIDPLVAGRAVVVLFTMCTCSQSGWPETMAQHLLLYFWKNPPKPAPEDIATMAGLLRRGEVRWWWCRPPEALTWVRMLQKVGVDPSALKELGEALLEHTSPIKRVPYFGGDYAHKTRVGIAAITGATLAYDEAFLDPYLEPLQGAEGSLRALFDHCATAYTSKPCAKWKKTAADLLSRVDDAELRERCERMVDGLAKFGAVAGHNHDFLRGVAWLFGIAPDPACCSLLGRLLVASGWGNRVGMRSMQLFGGTLWALLQIPGEQPIAEICQARSRVHHGRLYNILTSALETAATERNIALEELEDILVPTYDMELPGLCIEHLGDVDVHFEVVGSAGVALRWFQGEREFKSVPAAAQESSRQLAELRRAKMDAEANLRAQRRRFEGALVRGRSWAYGAWRRHLLEHPLLTYMVRRLIWDFRSTEGSQLGIALDGVPRDVNGDALFGLDDCTVALWHPLHARREAVEAWRGFLVGEQVRQPFKQAFREIYVLTDSERQARTCSNRFAGHILKRKQFAAMAALNGWSYDEAGDPEVVYKSATRRVGPWNLQADFGFHLAEEETGEGGADFNDEYVVTDDVRFYDSSWKAVALDDIPKIVFSEVMRDIGVIVGITSVGCDPTWGDTGAESFKGYWRSFAFGDLSATATTRKEVLEMLIPRLKELGSARLDGRFLVVPGRLRTYKIHLGSGHVLMEPNDQHLCIVPDSPALSNSFGPLFVPFEGDPTLDLIMSKALLLAHDDKIRDTTIARQIRRI